MTSPLRRVIRALRTGSHRRMPLYRAMAMSKPPEYPKGSPVTWRNTKAPYTKFTGTVINDGHGRQVSVRTSEGKYRRVRRDQLSSVSPPPAET